MKRFEHMVHILKTAMDIVLDVIIERKAHDQFMNSCRSSSITILIYIYLFLNET